MKMMSNRKLAQELRMDSSENDEQTGSSVSICAYDGEGQPKCDWQIGEKVMCMAGDNLFYEAKITEITDYDDMSIYSIHYVGWNAKYDEQLRSCEIPTRFKKFTAENKRKAAAEVKKAKEQYEVMQRLTLKPKAKKLKNSSQQSSTSSSKGFRKISQAKDSSSSGSYRSKSKSSEVKVVSVVPSSSALSLCIPPKQLVVQPIPLNTSLEWVLRQDRDYLLVQGMFPRIPAQVSVFDIIETFRVYLKNESIKDEERKMPVIPPEHTQASRYMDLMVYSLYMKEDLFTMALLNCFEHMAQSEDLFYEHERGMHCRLLEQLDNGEMLSKKFGCTMEPYKLAKLFGLPYLLRMLTQLHKMLASDTRLTQQAVDRLLYRCSGLVEFLTENWKGCFQGAKDYFLSTTYASSRKK